MGNRTDRTPLIASLVSGPDPDSDPEFDLPADEREIAEAVTVEELHQVLFRQEVAKRLSSAFGVRSRRRAQLVARLKQRRRYDKPVRGGTGKQARTRRRTF